RPLGEAGAVPDQGPGPARDSALVARRVLEGERAGRGITLLATKRSTIMNTEHFQNLIIGSGVAGKILAWTLASQGQTTVVVERAMVGGSCPNVACLPSKNGIYSAKAVSLVHPRQGLGVKYLLKQDLVRAALP